MTTPDINASQLRLYYLQQLGIAAYVPRDVSAASEAVAADVLTQQAAVAVAATATSTTVATFDEAEVVKPAAPRPVAARRAMIDDADVAAPVAPVRVATAAATAAATTEAEDTAPPFQLLLCVLDAELAMALQLPALATNGLREQEQKLLQNLLRWLGYPLPDLKSSLQFRWPLPGLPANSAAMATRTLSVFLQQAASTRPFRHLLLLGPVPAQCLQDQPAAWQLWPTHSLAELLALPQLKRDTWLQLQPLQLELQQKLH